MLGGGTGVQRGADQCRAPLARSQVARRAWLRAPSSLSAGREPGWMRVAGPRWHGVRWRGHSAVVLTPPCRHVHSHSAGPEEEGDPAADAHPDPGHPHHVSARPSRGAASFPAQRCGWGSRPLAAPRLAGRQGVLGPGLTLLLRFRQPLRQGHDWHRVHRFREDSGVHPPSYYVLPGAGEEVAVLQEGRALWAHHLPLGEHACPHCGVMMKGYGQQCTRAVGVGQLRQAWGGAGEAGVGAGQLGALSLG